MATQGDKRVHYQRSATDTPINTLKFCMNFVFVCLTLLSFYFLFSPFPKSTTEYATNKCRFQKRQLDEKQRKNIEVEGM